jgi:hypothetical protein
MGNAVRPTARSKHFHPNHESLVASVDLELLIRRVFPADRSPVVQKSPSRFQQPVLGCRCDGKQRPAENFSTF